MAKNERVRAEALTHGARLDFTQFGKYADTSATHWHVNP